MSVTVYQLALHLGAKEDARGRMSGEQFDLVGLPIMGSCQTCMATIAAYNACPQKNGYLSCTQCDDNGWESAEIAAREMGLKGVNS